MTDAERHAWSAGVSSPAAPGAHPGDKAIDAYGYFQALRSNWLVVGLVLVTVTAGAVAWSLTKTRVYTATASIVIADLAIGTTDTPGAREVAAAPTIVTSAEVLSRAARAVGDTDAATLKDHVTVESDAQAGVLHVTASSTLPRRAAALANAVAEAFVADRAEQQRERYAAAAQRIADAYRQQKQAGSAAEVTNLQDEQRRLAVAEATSGPGFELAAPATVPTAPSSPKPLLDGVIAFLAALIACAVGVAVKEQVRPGPRNISQASQLTGLPVLALVGADNSAYERYDSLAMRLVTQLAERETQVVVVSGIEDRDEPSELIAHLGRALADVAGPVLLISANLRDPQLSKRFGASGRRGLTDLLARLRTGDDVLSPQQITAVLEDHSAADDADSRVLVLPSGRTTGSPGRLLSPQRLRKFFTAARHSDVRYILVEAPALLSYPDAHALSAWADGVIAVTTRSRLPMATVTRLRRSVLDLPGQPLGLVVVPRPRQATAAVVATAEAREIAVAAQA